MSWPATFLAALLTAVLGAIASALVAALVVDWYRVSSFEGKSGYLVVFIGILGLLGGFVIGVVTSRLVAAGANPGFGNALGWSALVVVAIALPVAGAARLLADVPPTLGGEQLMLQVEVRWPASQQQAPGVGDPVARFLELGALSGHTLRVSKQGPLWLEDARLEGGQWIVPGAVEIFTSRGTRVLNMSPQLPGAQGIVLPLGGHPGKKDLAWSEWMPRTRSGAAPAAGGFSYRFKVLPQDQAVRTEAIGPFAVDTIAQSFHVENRTGGQPVVTATAHFAVRHRGQAIAIDGGRVEAVATLSGTPTALLVRVVAPDAQASCRLLLDEGDQVAISFVAHCAYALDAEPLTNDPAWRDAAKLLRKVSGRIDRVTFTHPGSYLFADAIFDAVQRTVRSTAGNEIAAGYHLGVAPLGISPDGHSFVRLGFSETERDAPALLVVNTRARTTYLVPIDRVATRVGSVQGLDVEWLAHYYRWQRDADGQDRLTARGNVQPLPFRGVVEVESSGNLVYRLQPAGKPMLDALAAFLRDDFKALQTPDDAKSYGFQTHIGDTQVHLFHNASEHYVSLYLETGSSATRLVPQIAEGFNSRLATGRYDTLFTP